MEAREASISAARGFLEGAGIDSLLWASSAYIPQLAQPSPLPVPFYDPAGIHYDDLIALGVSAGIAISGAVSKNWNRALEGAMMLLGSFLISQFQPMPLKPFSASAAVPPASTNTFSTSLVNLD